WFNKLLIANLRENLKNFMKDFYIHFEPLVIQLEFVRQRILDFVDCEPKLMHVDLKDFNSGKEGFVVGGLFQSIQNNLISDFFLRLCGINPHVTLPNNNTIIRCNQSIIKSTLLSDERIHDSAKIRPIQFIYK
ncbi:hypothetical protein Tco_1454378, partial [Tanacetum coccineum]